MKLVFLLPFVLTACVEADQPMISDFNGNSVKVVSYPYAANNDPRSPTWQTADAICKRAGKTAQYGSTRVLNAYQGEHTFLCL